MQIKFILKKTKQKKETETPAVSQDTFVCLTTNNRVDKSQISVASLCGRRCVREHWAFLCVSRAF